MDRRSFLISCTYAILGMLPGASGVARAFVGPRPPAGSRGRAALIIDDIGYSQAVCERFLSVDIPITYAVLPRLRYSVALAMRVHACGHEVMLHQPMEPIDNSIDPGPGALYVADGKREIERMVQDNLAWVPHAAGVNNHMGSRFTQTADGMGAALQTVRENALYFVDSLTSNRSLAYRIARLYGIPSTRRSVFLDNVRQESAVIRQLKTLACQARRWGQAVGIGHPYPETARAIARFQREGGARAICWVYASGVIGVRSPQSVSGRLSGPGAGMQDGGVSHATQGTGGGAATVAALAPVDSVHPAAEGRFRAGYGALSEPPGGRRSKHAPGRC